MARGKHRAATQQRYDQHAEATLQALRAELVEAKRARNIAEAKVARIDQLQERLRIVTDERDRNAAPEIARLRANVAQLEHELQTTQEELARVRSNWTKASDKMIEVLGIKGAESAEALLALIGENQIEGSDERAYVSAGVVTRTGTGRKLDPERIRRIQVARGWRLSADKDGADMLDDIARKEAGA